MGLYSTQPVKELSAEDFQHLLKRNEVILSPHALWHLSNQQRKVFNGDELIRIVKLETPRKVYIQENERYAAYYRKSDGYRKLIFEIKEDKAIIVTFVDTSEIPRYTV
ncbi:MAG: hypothetical protein Q8R53_04745 [Nanoarchaeota archaeon]|nr:hypothetical protein [Nanoarchaeota archaeon]